MKGLAEGMRLAVETVGSRPPAEDRLVTENRPATVRLHPVDMEAMAQPLREEIDAPGLQWLADPAVPKGGCMVESAGMVVDGSLDKRWQRAIAALGLQSPWSDEESVDGR